MNEVQARNQVVSRLQPGEKLVWSATPSPWGAAARGPFLMLLFALFFFGFSIFWILGAYTATPKTAHAQAPYFFLFGVPFVAVGIYQILASFKSIVDCWRTAYGLTDRRVIIATGARGKTQSLWPNSLGQIDRSGDDRRGTITFAGAASELADRRGWKPKPAFAGIAEPRKVEALIYSHLLTQNREGTAA